MKRLLLLTLGCALALSGAFAQGLLEEFDGDDVNVTGTDNITVTQQDGILRLAGNGMTGELEAAVYTVQVDGEDGTFDISANNIVSIRASASGFGTGLGIELVDASGNATAVDGNIDDLVPVLSGAIAVYDLDFTGNLNGIDATEIAQIRFIPDAGIGEFGSTIFIDALLLGERFDRDRVFPYLDTLSGDSAVTAFFVYSDGYSITTDPASGEASILGSGSRSFTFDNFGYAFRNQVDFSPTSIDFEEAGDLLYLKMRSTVPNTTVRIDLVDSRGFATAGAAVTDIVNTEYEVFSYDYTNNYFSGQFTEPCSAETAPCPVEASEIVALRIIVNPNSSINNSELFVDWVSVGEPFEAPPELPLLYTDCFDDGINNSVGDSQGFVVTETGGGLNVEVTSDKQQFSSFGYLIYDREAEQTSTVDIDIEPVLYARVRTDGGAVTLRADAIDSAGFASTSVIQRRAVTEEFQTVSWRYDNATDLAFGGTPCTEAGCPVDLSVIENILFFVNDGNETSDFTGNIIFDQISFGRPIEDGECNEDGGVGPGVDEYFDPINSGSTDFLVSYDGSYDVAATDSTLQIIGDGSAGGFQRVRYRFNDGSDTVLVNVAGTNDEIRIRARVIGPDTALARIDLIDNRDFSTTNAGRLLSLTNEFEEYVINYAGAYVDGGYGGTACPNGGGANPCPVDGQRASGFYIYPSVNPAPNGVLTSFNGTIEIERVGAAEVVSVNAPREVADVQVTPNPVTDQLSVSYELEVNGEVSVAIYDGIGRQVAKQSQGRVPVGAYRHSFDMNGLSTGIYQVVLSVDGYVGKTVSVVKQ